MTIEYRTKVHDNNYMTINTVVIIKFTAKQSYYYNYHSDL